MSAWLKFLVVPMVVAAGAMLVSPPAAQAQYGYYSAPAYGYPAPPPPAYYGAPYGYYPPAYGGYYARPSIGISFGVPFGFGGYRPYYHHHGRRW